jgi:hypothetical protein
VTGSGAPGSAPAAHALDLGHGLALRCAMDSLDDSVVVALLHGDHVLFDRRFHRRHDHDQLGLRLP